MNNINKIMNHYKKGFLYHNYVSPNNNKNRDIELEKGSYYDITPQNDSKKNNNKNSIFMFQNALFLGYHEKKISKWMPESGTLEDQKSNMCHFLIMNKNNKQTIMEIDADHILKADYLSRRNSTKKKNNKNQLIEQYYENKNIINEYKKHKEEINEYIQKKKRQEAIENSRLQNVLDNLGFGYNNNGGSKKTSRKNITGGEQSWGATGMPAQFYNPNKPLTSYPPNSGFGVPTAYGASLPLDVGTGLLAPFTASKAKTANLATMTKTGGTKKNSNTKKTPSKKTPKTQTDKKTPTKKAKKTSCNIKAKMMNGGEQSWGATGMPAQFYNAKKPLMSYPINSGFGVQTAYGKSLPLDVGTGSLAPFTASKSKTANMATMNKTGGANKKLHNKKPTTKPQKGKKPKKKTTKKDNNKKDCKM